jgi:hypothetical protein
METDELSDIINLIKAPTRNRAFSQNGDNPDEAEEQVPSS